MRYTGVVDRFEDDRAVILLEQEQRDVDDIVVDRSTLPEDARHVDAVLSVVVEDGELVEVTYDSDETEARADRAQSRFNRLSKRPPSDEE